MVDMQTLQLKVAELTAEYVEKLPEQLALFTSFAEHLIEQADHDIVEKVQRHAHKISGSAGSYGFSELGNAAASLELACNNLLNGDNFSDQAFDDITMNLFTLIGSIESTIKSTSE